MNIVRTFATTTLVSLLVVAAFQFTSISAANAAPCGGLNQKACPPLKPGPQCGAWLTKVNKFCRPCGGRNQRACPVLKAGKTCKPGLSRRSGRCVRLSPCGGINQRTCTKRERLFACNKGLEKRNGRCITRQVAQCGHLHQKPCKLVVGRRRCIDGLRVDLVKNRCVRQKYSLKQIGRQCIKQYKPMAPTMARLAKCLLTPKVVRVIRPLLKKKNGKLANRIKKVLLEGQCLPQINAAALAARRNGFKAISFGIGAQVGAGGGATSEVFLAMSTYLRGKPHLYEVLGWQFGWTLGGDITGVVTAHLGEPATLAGKGQTFSVGLKAVGGAGMAVGISPAVGDKPARCSYLAVNAGVGAAANVGTIGRSTSVKLF